MIRAVAIRRLANHRFAYVLAATSLYAACGGAPSAQPTATAEPEVRESDAHTTTVERVPTETALSSTDLILMRSTAPSVDFRIAFSAGSADDPQGKEGLTHLTARAMAEGGAGDRTYAERERLLYPMAAQLGVQVDREQTVFVGRVHPDHLDAYYALLLDVLKTPRFSAEDVDRVRTQTLQELSLELRENDDEDLGKEVLQSMIYEGHPFGHPALGTIAGLGAISADDLRAHWRRVFCGGRAHLGIAGNVTPAFAEQVRADLAALNAETCAAPAPVAPPAEHTLRARIVHKPQAQAVAVSMGMPIDVRRDHPDYPAVVLAVAYLGQHRQFAGRLMQKMRGDRGLNYGDYAYPEHFIQEGGTRFPVPNIARSEQYFSIWLRPVRPTNALFAIRMAARELSTFVEHGLSQEDFERIRAYIRDYYGLFLMTESRRIGYALDDAYYGLSRPWIERLRTGWDRLTVEEVNAAIRRHVHPDRLEIAIVAPDARGFADALASDREATIEYQTPPAERVTTEDREIANYHIGITADHIEVIPLDSVFAR